MKTVETLSINWLVEEHGDGLFHELLLMNASLQVNEANEGVDKIKWSFFSLSLFLSLTLSLILSILLPPPP